MSVQPTTNSQHEELSVAQARDHFSERVNRAAYGNEITYVTRGRKHERAAAIVPASFVEDYETLLDAHDARIARARLDDIRAGREETITLDEMDRELEP
ncbi:antitoxin of toxin-antitoxin stability system [Streptomonospora sp. PA3]|uniref:antitoxin of toxin-antitoxin stability system n=1 Tax=Streptomonospora sp. PA3 TaxID=2607326 RepID=UPI0012DDAF84|nr:antitoxin of toxin-antitoxin stability system [Streptomonospora sp. PA3]MUL43838.1 antitoxin of toxin-antitoxin stability system [Streptomonospora sp. PA3]